MGRLTISYYHGGFWFHDKAVMHVSVDGTDGFDLKDGEGRALDLDDGRHTLLFSSDGRKRRMELDLCGDDSFHVTWDCELGGITVVDAVVKRPTYRPAFRLFRILVIALLAYGFVMNHMRYVGMLSSVHYWMAASALFAAAAAGLVAAYYLRSRPIVRPRDRAA